MILRRVALSQLLLLTLAACVTTPNDPIEAQFLVVACRGSIIAPAGETFRIRLLDSAQIARAEAVVRGTSNQIVLGRLAHGDGGFNAPWHWHLKPDSTYLVDAAVEVCDACPSTVEAGGLFQFGSFCPWTSQVVQRER